MKNNWSVSCGFYCNLSIHLFSFPRLIFIILNHFHVLFIQPPSCFYLIFFLFLPSNPFLRLIFFLGKVYLEYYSSSVEQIPGLYLTTNQLTDTRLIPHNYPTTRYQTYTSQLPYYQIPNLYLTTNQLTDTRLIPHNSPTTRYQTYTSQPIN